MMIPIPKLISNLWKPQPRRAPERRHLMLAGIDQRVFLNQWGPPEVRINLDRLEGAYERRGVAFDGNSNEGASHTVWIYPKRDRICFFTDKRLVSHFKWSAFKEKGQKVTEKADLRSPRWGLRPAAVMAQGFSMAAS